MNRTTQHIVHALEHCHFMALCIDLHIAGVVCVECKLSDCLIDGEVRTSIARVGPIFAAASLDRGTLLSVRLFFGTCRVRFLLTLEATPSRRCTWPGKPGLSLRFLQMTLTFSERAQKLARPNQVR